MMARKLIIVVGKAGSGKSTLCQWLMTLNFVTISASQVLRETFNSNRSQVYQRHDLATWGASIRHTSELTDFHRRLRSKIEHQRGSTVLDGPRFMETIVAIKSVVSSTRIIFMDCPDKLRQDRLISAGRGAEWIWLADHPTERSVDEMRDMADFVVDARQSVPAIESHVRHFVEAMRT